MKYPLPVTVQPYRGLLAVVDAEGQILATVATTEEAQSLADILNEPEPSW